MENWKTTLVGIITLIAGFIPVVIQALMDFGVFLAQLSAVLGGDFSAFPALIPALMTFIASVTLIWARDGGQAK